MSTLPRPGADQLQPFAPSASRELQVFGAPMQLVLLPQRSHRADRPSSNRPAFRTSPVPRILAQETLWQDSELALTPNRYPFAAQQCILWPRLARREPNLGMWLAMIHWTTAQHGSALLNTVGAAASIAWAHAHLTPERMAFLDHLPERPGPADLIELEQGTNLVAKDTPFCLLGIRGPATGVARALLELAGLRLTAAWNVVVGNGTAWVMPRRTETAEHGFPYPLGAAELWGRCCYLEAEAFAAATSAGLEQAFTLAGMPAMS
jgi:hypothetical protein